MDSEMILEEGLDLLTIGLRTSIDVKRFCMPVI